MKTISLLTVLISLAQSPTLKAQELPYFFAKEIEDTSYTENKKILHGYQTHLLYSYVGNYSAALNSLNKRRTQKQGLDESTMNSYGYITAGPYIFQQATNRQIVIINEDHHNSSHRVFTASLLKGFANMGFKYFCAEGLRSRKSDSLNIRGYPVLTDVDYYDPQFSNMLREAMRLKFKVIGHDTANFAFVNNPDPFLFDRTRDSLGARKIQAILAKDPSAKIIIHCGQSHGYECTFDQNLGKRFAALVHEFTGIDPLTINQDHYQEKMILDGDIPLYLGKIKEVSVIDFGSKKYNTDCEDMTVIHPATKFVNNRPDWLLKADNQYFFPAKYLKGSENVLAVAYNATEPAGLAVPVDVAEIDGDTSDTALVLPPGKYNLLLINQSHQKRLVHFTVKASIKYY
jgi:hypothetical protein